MFYDQRPGARLRHNRNDLRKALPSSSELPSEFPPFLSLYCVIMVGRGSNTMSTKHRILEAPFKIVLLRLSNIWVIKIDVTQYL